MEVPLDATRDVAAVRDDAMDVGYIPLVLGPRPPDPRAGGHPPRGAQSREERPLEIVEHAHGRVAVPDVGLVRRGGGDGRVPRENVDVVWRDLRMMERLRLA